jgi:hypothetical protein
MLCVISLRPGFKLSIFAGVVLESQSHLVFDFRIMTYLGVFATFEERSHTNETDIVVPHDGILGVVPRDFENILKDFDWVSYRLDQLGYPGEDIPSKLSRPVFSKKSFFPLL